MIRVMNITSPNDPSDLYKIQFTYATKTYKGKSSSYIAQQIITIDIETSNGYAMKNGEVIAFDKERYDAEFDLPETERAYQDLIDNQCTPVSLMYMWQVGIESADGTPYVFIGRTWDEFNFFMDDLTAEIRRQAIYGFKPKMDRAIETALALTSKKVVGAMAWIHNEGFELQHFRNVYNSDFALKKKIFAREARKPIRTRLCINKVTMEIRDTLVLTQKSLKNWCKDAQLPIQKLEEKQEFYEGIITPVTPLSNDRIRYAINDVLSMIYGIEKYREKYTTLQNIPLTQTGEVRRTCRERLKKNDPAWCVRCCEIQRSYTLDLYKNLTKVFQGGWTHGNARWVDQVVGTESNHIKAFDFASSYPGVMTSRRFAISEWTQEDPQRFDFFKKEDIHTSDYRWFAKVKFTGVHSKLLNTYWSLSKCESIEYPIVDNGRVSDCESMTVWLTDLDYDTFMQAYKVKSVECLELYSAEAGYLSKELILTILDYFQYKTSLKGVDGSESLYSESKQFINAIYGVSVTKLVSKEVTFTEDGWVVSDDLTEEDFVKAMNSLKPEETFLAYQHGVWVTSWARHCLWEFIIAMDERVVYCDTDSIKGLFTDKDLKFVDKYNKNIEKLQAKVAAELGFDKDLYTATTSKGKLKRLAIMEREDDAIAFKTLGAKRYVYQTEDGKIHCTIAGLPKSAGEHKFKSVDEFNDKTFWRTGESGKLIAYYNDNQPTTKWTDCDGRLYISEDRYGLCLKPTTFDLSMTDEFKMFIATLMTGIKNDPNFFDQTPRILR